MRSLGKYSSLIFLILVIGSVCQSSHTNKEVLEVILKSDFLNKLKEYFLINLATNVRNERIEDYNSGDLTHLSLSNITPLDFNMDFDGTKLNFESPNIITMVFSRLRFNVRAHYYFEQKIKVFHKKIKIFSHSADISVGFSNSNIGAKIAIQSNQEKQFTLAILDRRVDIGDVSIKIDKGLEGKILEELARPFKGLIKNKLADNMYNILPNLIKKLEKYLNELLDKELKLYDGSKLSFILQNEPKVDPSNIAINLLPKIKYENGTTIKYFLDDLPTTPKVITLDKSVSISANEDMLNLLMERDLLNKKIFELKDSVLQKISSVSKYDFLNILPKSMKVSEWNSLYPGIERSIPSESKLDFGCILGLEGNSRLKILNGSIFLSACTICTLKVNSDQILFTHRLKLKAIAVPYVDNIDKLVIFDVPLNNFQVEEYEETPTDVQKSSNLGSIIKVVKFWEFLKELNSLLNLNPFFDLSLRIPQVPMFELENMSLKAQEKDLTLSAELVFKDD